MQLPPILMHMLNYMAHGKTLIFVWIYYQHNIVDDFQACINKPVVFPELYKQKQAFSTYLNFS